MRIPGSGEDNPVCHTFHGPNHSGIILILRNSHNNSAIPNPQMLAGLPLQFSQLVVFDSRHPGTTNGLGTQDFHVSRRSVAETDFSGMSGKEKTAAFSCADQTAHPHTHKCQETEFFADAYSRNGIVKSQQNVRSDRFYITNPLRGNVCLIC